MILRVQISRLENTSYFNVMRGDIVNIDIEDYLCGVVPAEMGEGPLEALKAQAIVARTFALPYAKSGAVITDESAKHQAFRTSRINWHSAVQAVHDTAGLVLCYGGEPLKTCVYSSSNGGKTVSSESRWGGVRPYLIEQVDPWDAAACNARVADGKNILAGHGVGMSQYGAAYAAGTLGVSFAAILAFYYPGTAIAGEYGEGDEPMEGKIKASDLVAYAREAVGGGYCFGSSGEVCSLARREAWAKANPSAKTNLLGLCKKWDGKKVWDCSGLFRGAWRALLTYRSGGATTIFNTWTSETGMIDTLPDEPGIAVFRANATKPATKEHIGLYIGGGIVIDARGSSTGVVIGTVSAYGKWTHWAKLADVDYSEAPSEELTSIWRGVVKTSKGKGIGIWDSPAQNTSFINAPDGATVEVFSDPIFDGFVKARYAGVHGYAREKYLVKTESEHTTKPVPVVETKDGKKGIFIQVDNPEAFLAALRAASIMVDYEDDDNDDGGMDK